jgi:hypothetical protein
MEITGFEVFTVICAIYGVFLFFLFFMFEYGWIFFPKKERIEHKIKALLEERDKIYWFEKFECNPAFRNTELAETNRKEYERRITHNFEEVEKLKNELNKLMEG